MNYKLKLLSPVVFPGFLLSHTMSQNIIVKSQVQKKYINEPFILAPITVIKSLIADTTSIKQSIAITLPKKNSSPVFSYTGMKNIQDPAGNYFQETICKPDFNKAKS
ncbi:hypothetical protein BH11BAC3_BH11BAC3_13210 [soil metagenome]